MMRPLLFALVCMAVVGCASGPTPTPAPTPTPTPAPTATPTPTPTSVPGLLSVQEYAEACGEWNTDLKTARGAPVDDRIDTLEAILRMMGSVLPPPELLDIHVQMAVILEQVTFLNKVAQADEQGESDGSFARMLIASGYLQLTDAALAAERAMDDLDPATARVLNENGCTVASP